MRWVYKFNPKENIIRYLLRSNTNDDDVDANTCTEVKEKNNKSIRQILVVR